MKALLVLVVALGLSGCATEEWVRGHVQQELKPLNTRLAALEGRAATADAGIKSAATAADAVNKRVDGVEETLRAHDQRIAEASKNAREAMERAMAAGKLAEGKFLYEKVMTDDTLRFGPGKAELSDQAKTALRHFADGLKQDNKNVYVEVQGHTDSMGSEAYNQILGLQRAEAVRQFLVATAGIPLHRIAAISYGESQPIGDNRYKAGRNDNRRVVLIVLR